jgi:hypothetical protein
MPAIELVALTAVGGLVIALVVQAVFHERALARLVRLAAQEPIEPRPEIPALPAVNAPAAPRRRITIPLPGIPWQAPRASVSPKSPAQAEEK